MSDLLIIFRKPPVGTSWAREAIDLALVGAAFGQQATLLFMGDGVYQLLNDQQPDQVEQKGSQAMMKALPMYDIDQVYVAEESLEERGLDKSQLGFDCEILAQPELQVLLKTHKQVFNF